VSIPNAHGLFLCKQSRGEIHGFFIYNQPNPLPPFPERERENSPLRFGEGLGVGLSRKGNVKC